MNLEKIGSFIKDIRKEKGLTQEQLAEKLGVSQKSVSRWETGKTMPDYSLLPVICEVLEINVAELLGAERISGDSVPKKQVTAMAQNMILLVNNKSHVRKIVGAILSAVIMLVGVVGLYNYEYSVSVDSTADLEKAINEYHFADEVNADVLERQAINNRLYVLYEENEYPGACGLACLEKGIFGNYRMISCEDSGCRWINGTKITEGKTDYCVTFCASDLPIDAYGICGDIFGQKRDGPAVVLQKRGDLGGMLRGKLRPDHHTALHQAARGKDLVPLGGEVQRHDEIRVLAAGNRDHGLGEDSKADFSGGDGGV